MVSVQSPVSHDQIIQSLQFASAQTGTDFDYLLETAQRESSLKPQAKAKTSSAAGLFQFIEQTWLGAVKQYGDKAGLETLSGSIGTNAKGRHIVANEKTKAEILALRHDVEVSSVIAGMMSRDSQSKLEGALGRELRNGELYVSHFMGVRGAQKFIEAYEVNALASAPDLFPAAAKANRRLFYAKDGSPLSLGEVYRKLTGQDDAPATTVSSPPARPSGTATPATEAFQPADLARSFAAQAPVPQSLSADLYGLRLAGFGDRVKSALPVSLNSSAVPASLVDLAPVILDVLAAMGEDPKKSNTQNGGPQSK